MPEEKITTKKVSVTSTKKELLEAYKELEKN